MCGEWCVVSHEWLVVVLDVACGEWCVMCVELWVVSGV